jgi:preprotein translocase subunit SecY
LQAVSLIIIFQRQGIFPSFDLFQLTTAIAVAVGGSILLMWIGELMTEFGISNGISLVIFAGIVAALPQQIGQMIFTFDQSQLPFYIFFAIAGVLVIAGVVLVTEAERSIPVTYAKQVRGGKSYGGTQTYLPIRINQAGVMPIIFALSILMFPQLIGGLLSAMANPTAQSVGAALATFTQTGWLYSVVYFILVVLFTYVYTAITFEPHTLAANLQKNGAFIPGVRPGEATEQYVGNIVSRITLVGALFLGIIAVLPMIIQTISGNTTAAIGGTALLIVVSVVLDVIKKADAQLSMREY